jgi:hypothetical protein
MACSVHSEDPESFSDRLVTGDESWFHCHTTEKSNNKSNFQSGVCELARTTPKTALLNPSDCYQKDFESILTSVQSMRRGVFWSVIMWLLLSQSLCYKWVPIISEWPLSYTTVFLDIFTASDKFISASHLSFSVILMSHVKMWAKPAQKTLSSYTPKKCTVCNIIVVYWICHSLTKTIWVHRYSHSASKLQMFKNRMLRKLFSPKQDELRVQFRILFV